MFAPRRCAYASDWRISPRLIFLALLAALCFEEINQIGDKYKLMSTGLAALMVVSQINNFIILNRSYISFHNDVWTRKECRNMFPLAKEKPLTRRELHDLWSAWKNERMTEYLRSHEVSTGAAFLLFELKYREYLCQLDAASKYR